LPASDGSGTGSPLRIDQASAQSSTVRAIGPTVSRSGASGKTPSLVSAPNGVLSPTTPQPAAGSRTEPPVSVPMAAMAIPSVTEIAAPEEEPPDTRPVARS
jgi:hypothetical protein